MNKLELLTEIYKVRNQLNVLDGKPEIDLNDKKVQIRIEAESSNGKKYLLEDEFVRVKKVLVLVKLECEVEKYYKTPEGIAYKTVLSDRKKVKQQEYSELNDTTKKKILGLIQDSLGCHWGIERFHSNLITISVIDQEKSTLDNQAFYFAQSIELRYEMNSWMKEGKETFDASFGSCGSFAVEWEKVGDRALYYVGIGKFFENKILIQIMKETMRELSSKLDSIHEEIEEIEKRLKNPFEYINQ